MTDISNDLFADRTSEGFKWREDDMSGIPWIRFADGLNLEPIFRYFAYNATSSMEWDACSLREWRCHAESEVRAGKKKRMRK